MVNGKRIEELMKEKGILGKDMAERVGVSAAMMSYIMSGLREPNVATLVRIAKELGVSLDELVS